MKRSFVFRGIKAAFLVLLCATLFAACNRNVAAAPGAIDRDTSYAFGMLVASQMGLTEFSFDYYAFMEGFRDFNENRETRLTQDAAMELIMTAITRMEEQGQEEMMQLAQANLEEGLAYLAQNAQRAGVITTASGLQYEVLVQGTGAMPGPNDTVRVHYEGTFLDGTVFDSSFARGVPTEFPVGMVIQGWVEGLQLMNVGSTFRFVIPADLAYGTHGMPPTIPPNAALIFRVELIDIL
jgi:FKBP-type peptidyl-prolyl cis-trans isomerase